MAKNIKRCSTSLVNREMQIKTILNFHFTPTRMAIIKAMENNKQIQRNWDLHTLKMGVQNGAATSEKQFDGASGS